MVVTYVASASWVKRRTLLASQLTPSPTLDVKSWPTASGTCPAGTSAGDRRMSEFVTVVWPASAPRRNDVRFDRSNADVRTSRFEMSAGSVV